MRFTNERGIAEVKTFFFLLNIFYLEEAGVFPKRGRDEQREGLGRGQKHYASCKLTVIKHLLLAPPVKCDILT